MSKRGKDKYIFLTSCIAFFFFSSFLASAHVETQSGIQWARYNGQDDEFSCLLPERPAAYLKLRPKFASEQKPPSGADEKRGRIYGAYANGIVYVIMSFDRVGKEQLSDFAREFQKYHRPEAEMTLIREITKDDVEGKQYHINLSGVQGITHLYSTKKHFYVLQAVGGNESNPSIRHFLSSFTLNGKNPIKDLSEESKELEPATSVDASSSASVSSADGQVFSGKEVSRKAIVVMRPEPLFPRAQDIQGRIRIKAVLSSSGKVDVIDVVEGRRFTTNLTLEAVRNIKFIPAIKDGRFVSQYVLFEFQFHTYL